MEEEITITIEEENNINTSFESDEISVDTDESIIPVEISDYERLINKPKINSIELIGNKTNDDLGIQDKMNSATNLEIINLF